MKVTHVIKAIHISPIEVKISADRRLVFQFITNFGTTASESGVSSRVLSREKNGLLVEFETEVPVLFGMRKMFRTVERVTLYEPERVEFEEIEGPLAMRRERLILDELGANTCFRYEANFAMKRGMFGWLLGLLFARPKLKHAVQAHLMGIGETFETRDKTVGL